MRILDKEQSYRNAKKKVDTIKGFYWHLFASIFAIIFLTIINYVTGSKQQWSLFPISVIIVSLVIHWFIVFKSNVILGSSWEERKIKELMQKEEEQDKKYYE